MSLFRKGLFAGLVLFFSLVLTVPRALAACGACFISHTEARHNEEEPNISSGPMINSPTATTLGRNHVSASFIFDTIRYNPIPPERAHELHEEGRHIHGWLHEETYNLQAGYGILNDLDLYITGAIVDKTTYQVEEHEELGKIENAQGIGDSKLVAKYRFWKQYVEVAALVGVKFPTGEKGDRDSLGAKFETEIQPGSGAWDGEFGIVVSRNFWQHLSVASSFQYVLRGNGQHENLGDLFFFNTALSYAFRKLGKYPNLSLVAELNNRWALKDNTHAEGEVFDSGGSSVFVTPGVVANITKNLSGFWGISIPIHQNLGGEHEETRLETKAGVSLHF